MKYDYLHSVSFEWKSNTFSHEHTAEEEEENEFTRNIQNVNHSVSPNKWMNSFRMQSENDTTKQIREFLFDCGEHGSLAIN